MSYFEINLKLAIDSILQTYNIVKKSSIFETLKSIETQLESISDEDLAEIEDKLQVHYDTLYEYEVLFVKQNVLWQMYINFEMNAECTCSQQLSKLCYGEILTMLGFKHEINKDYIYECILSFKVNNPPLEVPYGVVISQMGNIVAFIKFYIDIKLKRPRALSRILHKIYANFLFIYKQDVDFADVSKSYINKHYRVWLQHMYFDISPNTSLISVGGNFNMFNRRQKILSFLSRMRRGIVGVEDLYGLPTHIGWFFRRILLNFDRGGKKYERYIVELLKLGYPLYKLVKSARQTYRMQFQAMVVNKESSCCYVRLPQSILMFTELSTNITFSFSSFHE